jgi:type I restriction enzyme S subunit
MKRNFVSLGAISEIMGGYAFKSSMMSNEPKEFQIIKMSNLYKGSLDLNRNPSFWEKTDKKTERYLLQSNDILMTLTGTVGKCDYGYTVQIKNEVNLLLNQRVCRIRPMPKKVDSFYIFQYLRSQEFLNKFFNCSIGGTGNQSNVGISDLRELDVYIPPLPEQKAIADLLSTWDEAIEKTERLIQAKEKRFKWLLRRLISEPQMDTDKHGWKKVKLGEVCKITKGKQLNVSHMKDDGAYYALNGGIEPSGRTDDWNTDAETITISEGGNSCGYVNYNAERFWSGGHCYSLQKLKKDIDKHYLYFYLKTHEPKLMKLRVGSGLPNIQKKDVDKFIVVLPPLPKQQKIAEALSTAQQEINLLKQISEKYKTQKRGLMQKMLTGEWRVKKEVVMKYE